MKGFVKCLIAGAILVGIGIVILLIGLSIRGWDFNPEYIEATYMQESENIDSLKIEFSAGEFEAVFYDGDKIEIDYYESSSYKVEIEENGTKLSFKTHNRWWFIGFHNPPKTVIKLPQDIVYNLEVDMSAGVVRIPEGTFGNMDIAVSAGLAELNGNIVCDTLNVDMSAGKVEADKITCSSLTVDLSAGEVNIDRLSCPVIDIDLSAGSVNMHVDGVKAEYNIHVDRSAGSCSVGNQTGTDSSKRIDIDLSAGSVNLIFDN